MRVKGKERKRQVRKDLLKGAWCISERVPCACITAHRVLTTCSLPSAARTTSLLEKSSLSVVSDFSRGEPKGLRPCLPKISDMPMT